jgi:hypothetical protein
MTDDWVQLSVKQIFLRLTSLWLRGLTLNVNSMEIPKSKSWYLELILGLTLLGHIHVTSRELVR